ncbi:MAG: thiamine-monophosphate kinase, partial [Candidatus Portiera sp.]|nr:thiamine-monophosphate kinase [Portiera sp.]
MDEFQIIQLIREVTSSYFPQPHPFPTDDDAAQIAAINHQAIISVDALEEDIHFPAEASPFLIGYRAVAVAVSDLAAMGARPRGCFLSLSLPHKNHSHKNHPHKNRPHKNHSDKNCKNDFIKDLAAGFGLAASRVAMPLLGGNIIQGKSCGLSVTVIGDGNQCLGRRGAKGIQVGDAIYVSGFLGD